MPQKPQATAGESKARRRFPWDAFAVVSLVIGLALTTFDFLWAFFVAPMVVGEQTLDATYVINGMVVDHLQVFSQKIFYFHVPVAVVSMAFIIIAAIYGVMFLVKREADESKRARYDMRTRLCMQVGLVFILATMASGILWTRIEWGVWWVWEPRLTTYFILMLLVFAYFILRTAIDDPEKRARFSTVFAILAAVDAPISYSITRLVPSSIHPVISYSGLETTMLIPFLCGIFGMSFAAFGIYRLRLRIEEQAVEVESLKRRYEELEG